MKTKYLWVSLVVLLVLFVTSGGILAQTGPVVTSLSDQGTDKGEDKWFNFFRFSHQ